MRNVLYLLYVVGMSKSRNEDFQISSICLVSRNEDIPMTIEEINLLLCQFFGSKITKTSLRHPEISQTCEESGRISGPQHFSCVVPLRNDSAAHHLAKKTISGDVRMKIIPFTLG